MTLNRVLAGGANARWPCECGCAERVPRYPTDLTDEQWAVLEPVLPVMLCDTELGGTAGEALAADDDRRHVLRRRQRGQVAGAAGGLSRRGRPYTACMPAGSRTGYWPMSPTCCAPPSAPRRGRQAEPSAAIIDSQSVHESAEGVVPTATSGFDQLQEGQRAQAAPPGRHRAACSSRSSSPRPAPPTVTSPCSCCARPAAAAAASPWPGPTTATTATGWPGRSDEPGITTAIVERPRLGRGAGFKILPRRWVIERTNAWISRRRRCARDYERLPAHHAAMVHWAAILQMTRRLARSITPAPTTL